MNRNFKWFNIYLNKLMDDVYPQPEDIGHTKMALEMFDKWFRVGLQIESVLDAGCGDTAFMKKYFDEIGVEYTGIALKTNHPDVINMDFSFLEFEDMSFDCVLARHSLEHSPMPLLTLMEWHRVSKHFLCLVLPNPDYFGWVGKNHYAVMNQGQIEALLERSGWRVIWYDFLEPQELRFMCERV